LKRHGSPGIGPLSRGIEFDLDEGETDDLIDSIRRVHGPADDEF